MIRFVTVAAVLGSGIMAGLFYVFSGFLMTTLRSLPAPHGIATMQSINQTILNPIFLLTFLGTAALSVGLVVHGLLEWGEDGALARLAGGAAYLVGVLLITAVFNVPRNNALDAVGAETEQGMRVWRDYLTTWTRWNHVRTVSSIAATVLFALSLG